ncbi:MAG: DUF4043 family protein [Candidatus Nitrosotenuis sp.]
MAETTIDSGNNVEQWADKLFVEYVRINPFRSLMGNDENSCIQVKEELVKEAGDQVHFSLIGRLKGAGVENDNTLMGNEENMPNYSCSVTVNQLRHGVVVSQHEQVKTKIDLLNAARSQVRTWAWEKLRDLCLSRMFSPVVDGLTTYSAATETQKDAWSVANNPSTDNQRIVFGASLSNYSGVHATDLAKIDGTADDAHQNIIRLLKRRAQNCDPHIRPVVVPGNEMNVGGERFYALMGSLAMRDLKANFETTLANADVRGDGNILFAGTVLKVDNVVCVEVPEMDYTPANGGCLLENVGDSSTTDVGPIFLLGAQALILAWSKRTSIKTDEWDYQNKRGVAVAETRGCKKTTFNSFMHGQCTGYVSAVGD